MCKNPLLAEERARKRQELLTATERELDKIVEANRRKRQPLRGKEAIAGAQDVGPVQGGLLGDPGLVALVGEATRTCPRSNGPSAASRRWS
ncbi:MAG TPA: hypothetical protein VLF66_20140 [Thermoanaerobaculia bacterium]|nr:hypothetical protein [Thermoanaerobaculia bacterium]